MPSYRNLNFRSIECSYAKKAAIRITGLLEKPMRGLQFEQIDIKAKAGIQIQDAGDIRFKQVKIVADEGPEYQFDECFDISVDGEKDPQGAGIVLIGSSGEAK
jgi:hypothetical protein